MSNLQDVHILILMNNPIQQHWDDMYSKPLSDIPWEITDPPIELTWYVTGKNFSGKMALDIGCGTGNYTAFMAEQGFSEVIGVDFSSRAISIAKKLGSHYKNIQFIVGDVTKLQPLMSDKKFDFIFDYSILHHIEPLLVQGYANQFDQLLKPGGTLLLVCYSDKDAPADGSTSAQGKYGNTMYYRTAGEIKNLYKKLQFEQYKETKLGKRLHHEGHSFLFKKG